MDSNGNEKKMEAEMKQDEVDVAASNSSTSSGEGTLDGRLMPLRSASNGRWGEEQDGDAVDVASAIGGFEEYVPSALPPLTHNPL